MPFTHTCAPPVWKPLSGSAALISGGGRTTKRSVLLLSTQASPAAVTIRSCTGTLPTPVGGCMHATSPAAPVGAATTAAESPKRHSHVTPSAAQLSRAVPPIFTSVPPSAGPDAGAADVAW